MPALKIAATEADILRTRIANLEERQMLRERYRDQWLTDLAALMAEKDLEITNLYARLRGAE